MKSNSRRTAEAMATAVSNRAKATKPEATHVDDLRKVFEYITLVDSPVTPGEVVQAHKGINSRYARELLATLQQADLIVNTEDPEDPDSEAFQANADQVRFDEWAGTAKSAKPAAKTKDESYHDCYCGCGDQVPSRSFYRPGHDARHAGAIGKEIAANYTTKGFDRRELLAALPSEKLVAKAELIAEKAVARLEAKADKAANRTEDGTVKVGKKEFAATRDTQTGEVVYYDGPDVKSASKTAAKTFKVG